MIPVAEPIIGEEELQNVTEAIKSGWISSKGKFIEEFEESFCRFCGRKYGVATSNGTTALHLALKALGIGKDDEIIIPSLTFLAVANSVRYCNAKPIMVDIHPDYWCIDPYKIKEKISKKTKAIIPVHLYGNPCDMNAIQDIAHDYDLYVIEDAAEAHGAEYKGEKVGKFGDISCFSFYGNKIITTGEGGMCLTNNEDLKNKMMVLRDHGMDPKKRYWHNVIGFNYRMTNLQAAVGVAQLKKITTFISKKREIAQWYAEKLKSLADEHLISLHPQPQWSKSVYWMYSIVLEDSFGVSREEFMRYLEKKGIETRPFFYPVYNMPPYKENGESFKVTQYISPRGMNLPSSPNLTKKDIEYIVETCLEKTDKKKKLQ